MITGNDIAARQCSTGCWVVNPKETKFFCEMILNDLKKIDQENSN